MSCGIWCFWEGNLAGVPSFFVVWLVGGWRVGGLHDFWGWLHEFGGELHLFRSALHVFGQGLHVLPFNGINSPTLWFCSGNGYGPFLQNYEPFVRVYEPFGYRYEPFSRSFFILRKSGYSSRCFEPLHKNLSQPLRRHIGTPERLRTARA